MACLKSTRDQYGNAQYKDYIQSINITLASNNVFARYVDAEGGTSTLNGISRAIHDIQKLDNSEIQTLVLRPVKSSYYQYRTITFTNICGKIIHAKTPFDCFRPQVYPFISEIKNGFGSFRGLFGVNCNLVLCGSEQSTLFRGATSTRDIREYIDHAIQPDSIGDVFVHMLCATSRLGKPIHGYKNDILTRNMVGQAGWNARMQMETEEKAYMFSFKIDTFSPEFLHEIAPQIHHPISSLLINVNFKGSMNFFLSIDSNTPFSVDLEEKYRPIFEHFHNVISESS